MYHEIAAQGVILRVLDVVGCHGASDVASLLQHVIHLQAQRTLVALQERLRDGGVPQHLVLLIAFAITGVGAPGDVALQLDVPRQVDGRRTADSIIIGVLVVLPLQAVACLVVADVTIHTQIQVSRAEVDACSLAEDGILAGVLRLVDVAVAVIEGGHRHGVDGELLVLQRRVEDHPGVGTVVAVHVFIGGSLHTGLCVIGGVAHDVVHHIVAVRHHHQGLLALWSESLEADHEVVGVGRVQIRITDLDVGRVGDIGHRLQLGHARL